MTADELEARMLDWLETPEEERRSQMSEEASINSLPPPQLREGTRVRHHLFDIRDPRNPWVTSHKRIGEVVWLAGSFGHPPYRQWVEMYFQSGRDSEANRRTGANCTDEYRFYHGRTPAELLAQGLELAAYLEAHFNDYEYDRTKVALWYANLVLYRTWIGAHREKAVLGALNEEPPPWRHGTWEEDRNQGVDIICDEASVGVQVKPQSFLARPDDLAAWKALSSNYSGVPVLVVACDNEEFVVIGRLGDQEVRMTTTLAGLRTTVLEVARG